MFYEIRKDVPLPPKGLVATIREMKCGDVITIPSSQRAGIHACAKLASAKVKTKSNGDGTVTVWRISPAEASTPETLKSPPGYSEIERTIANPKLGLPAGYYIQQDRYSPRVWVQGEPPIPVNKDIFS